MGGGGRGAGTAPCACQLRVSARTYSVECSVRVCARSARRRQGRGAAGGAGRGGTKADASSKRREIRRSCTQHGPRRACRPWSRGDIKCSNECRIRVARLVRSVYAAVYLSTYAGETLSSNVVQPVKSTKVRSRAAGAFRTIFACSRSSKTE